MSILIPLVLIKRNNSVWGGQDEPCLLGSQTGLRGRTEDGQHLSERLTEHNSKGGRLTVKIGDAHMDGLPKGVRPSAGRTRECRGQGEALHQDGSCNLNRSHHPPRDRSRRGRARACRSWRWTAQTRRASNRLGPAKSTQPLALRDMAGTYGEHFWHYKAGIPLLFVPSNQLEAEPVPIHTLGFLAFLGSTHVCFDCLPKYSLLLFMGGFRASEGLGEVNRFFGDRAQTLRPAMVKLFHLH